MEDYANAHTATENAATLSRSKLSEKRYDHTLRVADTAADLAQVHGLDEDRARLSAFIHDAARETEPEEFLRLAEEWNLPVGDPERQSPKLLHGPVAAELARRELGVRDEEVLEAVRAHTTAKPGMGPLALTLYVADKIEPARDYPSVERLRKLAREDLHMAAAESLRRAIAHNEGRGKDVHPSSRAALEWLESDPTPQGGIEQQQGIQRKGERQEGHTDLDGTA